MANHQRMNKYTHNTHSSVQQPMTGQHSFARTNQASAHSKWIPGQTVWSLQWSWTDTQNSALSPRAARLEGLPLQRIVGTSVVQVCLILQSQIQWSYLSYLKLYFFPGFFCHRNFLSTGVFRCVWWCKWLRLLPASSAPCFLRSVWFADPFGFSGHCHWSRGRPCSTGPQQHHQGQLQRANQLQLFSGRGRVGGRGTGGDGEKRGRGWGAGGRWRGSWRKFGTQVALLHWSAISNGPAG